MFREVLKQHIYKNELLRNQKSPSDFKGQQSPSNSYVDFLGQNQNQLKAQKKSLSYDSFKLRKIRALYGKRVTMQINEQVFSHKDNEKVGDTNKDSQTVNEEFPGEAQADSKGFLQKLIIHPDSKWKSIFDVFVLLLVAYSCINSMLNVTFIIVQTRELYVIYWVVESFFYLDFILSFFQGYRDVEEQKLVFEYKKIALRYLQGWFIIDTISIFPFQLLQKNSNTSQWTKLFRLPRMLRMIKLLDINNVKRLLKSFQGEISNAN